MKLRLGHKLIATSMTGVALAVALVAINTAELSSIRTSVEEYKSSVLVQGSVAAAGESVRAMRISSHKIQLAETPQALDTARTSFATENQDAVGNLTSARDSTRMDATRAEASETLGLVGRYADLVSETAAVQATLLTLRDDLTARAAEWTDGIATLDAASTGVDPAQRATWSLLTAKADAAGKDARIAVWRYEATGDATMMDRAEAATAEAKRILGEMASIATAPAAQTAITAQMDRAEDLRATGSALLQAGERQHDLFDVQMSEIGSTVERLLDSIEARSTTRQAELETAAREVIQEAVFYSFAFGAGLLVLLIGSAAFGVLGVARPVGRVAGVLDRLVKGDRSVAIPYVGRSDEIGEAANAAAAFKESLARTDAMTAEQAAAEARAEAEKKRALREMADRFQSAVGTVIRRVQTAAAELQGAAGTMSAAAEETTQQSTAVAGAAEEATANVQTVASATEELSSSVAEIARQVAESASIAAGAMREADMTGGKVAELAEAARKIGDVVELISAIASQTNLLALNATIEAARAGEAGRGFAVVASEVKLLADQTGKATGEIARQIDDIQSSTAAAAAAIGAITETIRRMNDIGATVAAAMEEQGAATREIARNVQQASIGTAEVSSNITGVTRAVADSSAASTQVLTSATDLAGQSDVLEREVTNFLGTIRAA